MPPWHSHLTRAKTLDDAAAPVLDELRGQAQRSLGEDLVARGLVHRRSRGSYDALVIREWGEPGDRVLSSTTLWSWVEREQRPIGLDVATGRGTVLEANERSFDVPAPYLAHDAGASVQALRARQVTHVVALPLIVAGEVFGMAALELSWLRAIAQPWPIGGWCTALQQICDLAAPALAVLPSAESGPAQARDELLPVVGSRMQPIVRVLRVFVRQDETLLFTGPTGSGKSRLAHWCHANSTRSEGPFKTANLLAVPDEMQMAELFGWKQGAFTGATTDHVGLVGAAEGGTLFLDEIDKLSLKAQAGLLHLLETRQSTRLGDVRQRSADVRFIVGTNVDLPAAVRDGTFREDLFYRINVLPVHLPPLRDRRDEIEGWARVMLGRRAESGSVGWTPDALERLTEYTWPGNLRQLENVVRRAYALSLARAPGGHATIEAADVDAALGMERAIGRPAHIGATALVEQAAEAIVEAALNLRGGGEEITLKEIDALRGAVLKAAADRLGGVKEAYLLFGGQALVRSRNHQKEFRRAAAEFEALLDKLRSGR